MTLLIPAMFSFFAWTASAAWDTWYHIPLKTEGIDINIDHQVNVQFDGDYKPTDRYMANPLYINVSGPNLTGKETVRVVLNQYDIDIANQSGSPVLPVTYLLTLKWMGAHFSGEIGDAVINRYTENLGKGKDRPLIIHTEGQPNALDAKQDLAVEIDGRWIKNGQRNFEFNIWQKVLAQSPNFCAEQLSRSNKTDSH